MASDDEMRILISEEPDEEMKAAYSEMLDGCIKYPHLRQWYAAWFIDTHERKRIGDLCFKGITDDGMVEIGYGLIPEFWRKGYATEAVIAMIKWALQQPGVKSIEAETEACNIASQRVLEKAGFVPTGKNGEEGPRFILQNLVKDEI